MNKHYDQRIRNLLQIESTLKFLAKVTGLFVAAVFILFLLAKVTKAQAIPDMFLVPTVYMTNSGVAVVQPQTGAGYDFVTNPNLGTETLESGTSFRPPKYDAFADGSANMKVELPAQKISTAQNVDFSVRNNMPGNSDYTVGTVKTTFTFLAAVVSSSSFNGTAGGDFEYRWDFNNDGKEITYFSHLPSVNHQFKKAGIYPVKLEVLDKNGKVSQVIKNITVVENTPPHAVFGVDKVQAPVNTIFTFDSSLSSDDQYNRYNLYYRFDWDSDGQWDTNYQNKNQWNHIYREAGHYKITMEAMDPEGAKSKSALEVDVTGDLPPHAEMTVGTENRNSLGLNSYTFDASGSSDDHTPLSRLKFRWDFNYSGKNDIVFDSAWSNSPKFTGSYKLGGSKTIRLQVMDEQGQIDEAFSKIEVAWPQEYLDRAVKTLVK
jgi:PKD repeat protein